MNHDGYICRGFIFPRASTPVIGICPFFIIRLSIWDVHKPFPCFDSWISTQEDGTAMVKFHCLSFVSPIQEGESSCGLDGHSSNTM